MNIVITGASKGIGFAVAKKMCTYAGNTIVAISRNEEQLEQLQDFCSENYPGSKLETIVFDLGVGDYLNNLLPQILRLISSVDVLINNAGLLINKPFEYLSDTDFDEIFNVNVKAVFKLTKTLLPHMNKNCHIVNAGSMGGVQGSSKFPGLSLYSAAKGAVAILSEAMAEELKEKDIKVNCLAYGAVQTEMLSMAFPGYQVPLQPEEMAEFVAEFALNGHKYFNGKVLPVSVSTP
nr:SDR family oxidoreductase [Bacteroidota bacterium]